MWMVSNLLYITIIFKWENVPNDCLNSIVSVAVISKPGFWNITIEIKKCSVYLDFLLAWRKISKVCVEM